MPNYVRANVPGGTYWFTVVTERRAKFLTEPVARRELRLAVETCRAERPFTIDAFVLLPDHIHTIWTLPDDDADYPARWSTIKRLFAQAWVALGGREQPVSESRRRNRRLGVWQRRYYEHVVRGNEFEALVAYTHLNPVRHGYCRCPHDWPWSSFHRFVAQGRLPADWQCQCDGPPAPVPPSPDWIRDCEHS